MKALIHGRILMPDREVRDQALLFDEKIIGLAPAPPMGAEVVDAGGRYISPGFVDVHIHGYGGQDASDGDPEGLRAMARGILPCGVTSFLPTTMTVPLPDLEKAWETIRRVMPETASPGFDGAEILGCHAEGPFINPKKKGAQAEEAILPPDAGLILPWADLIRLITIAPEMPGAMDCIRSLRGRCAVSVGHTDADFDTALAALAAGADHFTHTFNAMTGLNHREPGVVGAALTDDRVYCELIADTFHVDPLLFSLVAKQKGDHLALITDSIQVAHLPDGPHDQSGQTVIVDGIRCRFPDGTIAGSSLTLDRAVRNFREHTGLPLYEVVNMASLYPARSVGLDGTKGSLEPGKDADIVITDGDFNVRQTFVRGESV